MIEYIGAKEGVEWVKMEDICDDFKSKHQPPKGALLPAEVGAILKDPSESPSGREGLVLPLCELLICVLV